MQYTVCIVSDSLIDPPTFFEITPLFLKNQLSRITSKGEIEKYVCESIRLSDTVHTILLTNNATMHGTYIYPLYYSKQINTNFICPHCTTTMWL